MALGILALLLSLILFIAFRARKSSSEHVSASNAVLVEMLDVVSQKLSSLGRAVPNQAQEVDKELEKLKTGAHSQSGELRRLVDILEKARARREPIPQELVKVMLDMESVMLTEIPTDRPATQLRARAKQWAATLKYAAQVESSHISESIANVCLWSLMAMAVAFLLSLLFYLGPDSPLEAFDSTSFFAPKERSVVSYVQYLFLPFGWNLSSFIPYIMAISTIATLLSPIPYLGPVLARIGYLVLFCRFLWNLRISLITLFSGILIFPLPFASIGSYRKLPRLYILIPCICYSLFCGWLVSRMDSMMPIEYRWQNPIAPLIQYLASDGSYYL